MMNWQFWIDVGGTFTDCVALAPDGQLWTWKTLSSGKVKGHLASRSGTNVVVDDLPRDPDVDFWRGWMLEVDGVDAAGVPSASTGPRSPEAPPQRWRSRVVSSQPDGTLTLEDELPRYFIGRACELACDEPAPLICIRHLLELKLFEPIPAVDVRLGTTRGTNALLERKGARTALLTTRGFADLPLIGNQDRPQLFALDIVKPTPLFERVIEVDERLAADGSVVVPAQFESGDTRQRGQVPSTPRRTDKPKAAAGRSPSHAPGEDKSNPSLRAQLEELKSSGIESLAVALLHSYRDPAHELAVERAAREAGFDEISLSSRVSPTIKIVPRAETTVLDAYLNPVLRRYVADIQSRLGRGSTLKLMSSQGGLLGSEEFTGKDSILSGPAGGVIAAARVAQQAGFTASIGFDMGGTSTDVSRFGGRFELEHETVKAGVRVASPMLAIETVAAGGGSVCWFDGTRLRVGPESAGADPGPACYGRGGPLTITDVNVALGRVLPDRFAFPLDRAAIRTRLEEILKQIESSSHPVKYSREELAQGFVQIANETMAQAIRKISIRKGYDPAEHVLVCFGGAAGQHACAIARMCGMSEILVHPFAGLLSAFGMGLANIRRRAERTVLRRLTNATLSELEPVFAELESELRAAVRGEGIREARIPPAERSLQLRYLGTESALTIPLPEDADYAAAFARLHLQLYGYIREGHGLEIVSLACEVVGRLPDPPAADLPEADAPLSAASVVTVWHNGESLATGVYLREQLRAGHELRGPAVLCDAGSTLWIEPKYVGRVGSTGTILIERLRSGERGLTGAAPGTGLRQEPGTGDPNAPVGPSSEDTLSGFNPAGDTLSGLSLQDIFGKNNPFSAAKKLAGPDPIQLEIFNNQFASIAEQMGITLRKTSLSTNVKERLDYSCALFDAQGGIVVNAPHIPVHLGAMGETVKCLLRDNPQLRPGDVFLTNDPYAGGSHLPDLTVVSPVHDPGTRELIFLTASRAHHAEIGGITPGSMPPFSTSLGEEGVLISNFQIVSGGQSRMGELRKLLTSGRYPSRSPDDNLADVAAQVAANQLGSRLLLELTAKRTLAKVRKYMGYIQQAAAARMRAALARLGSGTFSYADSLDDGTPIVATITISGEAARIDFTGTGGVVSTNLNANRAIVHAAVMYVFRCLIDEDIPLNSGVLEPLTIVLPDGLLNPPIARNRARCPAVVGGNVETSQRIVDVLLGALGQAAASQGTMNNFSFGDKSFGYYETICGGAGATSRAPGADAVHTHMTNTRLTDVEVIEHRYPVRIQEFSIRRGSGGAGQHRGGDGIRRVVEFLKPMEVSLLTQRRGPFAPFGLAGGAPGALGRNLIHRAGSAQPEALPAAAQVSVRAGDRIIIETPGGGGWGGA